MSICFSMPVFTSEDTRPGLVNTIQRDKMKESREKLARKTVRIDKGRIKREG